MGQDTDFINQINKEVESRLAGNFPDKPIKEEKAGEKPVISASYQQFKKEQKEEFSLNSMYEKYCSFSEKYLGFTSGLFGQKTMDNLKEEIEIASLNITPRGAISSLFMTQLIALIIAMPFLLIGTEDGLSFTFFIVSTGAFLAVVSYTYAGYRSEITKIESEQESILAILYMTIYMRVNPILENAMYFAAEHLHGPLGKDLKQCLWLVDNEKVGTLQDAVQFFIPLWIKRNPDFVKSMLLLNTVLDQIEKEDQARILDKSLDMILESTYEKMKHYAHDLQMPVTLLHTFGMMLPLIGLIAFPMMSIFMAENVKISYLFFGYIIVLPMLLFFFTRRIIAKRPGAFSYPDITNNPYVPPEGMYRLTMGNKSYLIPVKTVAILVAFVLLLPGVFHLLLVTFPGMAAMKSGTSAALGAASIPKSLEPEYEIASVLTVLTIPLGLGAGIAIYFYFKSIQKLRIRNDVVEIEDDLSGALFQFANQFTEQIPIEDAVQNFTHEYVMLNLKKRSIFGFFSSVLDRIQDEGVTFDAAIFDSRRGVIIRYPSILLKEISWIIAEGAKKGSEIVHNILGKISIYLDNAHKVKELIYDLLTETVQSINVQAKFLAPFIAAIVGSLSLAIIKALYEMARKLDEIMNSMSFGGSMSDSSFFSNFINFQKVPPPTIFSLLVGIYLVETVVLLSLLSNGVENGFDNVSRDITVARNLTMALIVYLVISVVGAYALMNLISAGLVSTN